MVDVDAFPRILPTSYVVVSTEESVRPQVATRPPFAPLRLGDFGIPVDGEAAVRLLVHSNLRRWRHHLTLIKVTGWRENA